MAILKLVWSTLTSLLLLQTWLTGPTLLILSTSHPLLHHCSCWTRSSSSDWWNAETWRQNYCHEREESGECEATGAAGHALSGGIRDCVHCRVWHRETGQQQHYLENYILYQTSLTLMCSNILIKISPRQNKILETLFMAQKHLRHLINYFY